MKKFLIALLITIAGFGMTVAPASAAWTQIGVDRVNFYNYGWGKNFHQGFVKHSSGGKILIKVPYTPISSQAGSAVMEMQIWEDDGNDILDDRITTVYHYAPKRPAAPSYYSVDVSKYVDGVNRKAEIYIKYGGNFKTKERLRVVVYD